MAEAISLVLDEVEGLMESRKIEVGRKMYEFLCHNIINTCNIFMHFLLQFLLLGRPTLHMRAFGVWYHHCIDVVTKYQCTCS